MANSTLLSLFQTTLQGMGLALNAAPATVISNTDNTVTQALALVNAAGGELNREHQWQGATVEYLFTTTYYQYTATLTTSSPTITALSSTTGLTTSPTLFAVTGTGIATGTMLLSVAAGPATAVLSRSPTAAGTAVTLTFAQVKYAFPTDYDRLVDDTEWDKSQLWQMAGPQSAQQWQWLKSGFGATSLPIRFRPLGLYFQIWPPMSSSDYMGFEYQSKYWILAASGTAVTKELFTVDTDTCIFPDPLMRALIKLKVLEAKGLDTTGAYRDYMAQRDIAKAADAGSPTLSMAPDVRTALLTLDNVPDTGYGS